MFSRISVLSLVALTAATTGVFTDLQARKGCSSCKKTCAPAPAAPSATKSASSMEHSASASTKSVAPGTIVKIHSMSEFNQYIQEYPQVVVKFYATWCGPCKTFAPIFESVAHSAKDILFIEIDGDKGQEIVSAHNVQAFPTTLFFKDGKRVKELRGGPAAETFKSAIREVFGADAV